MFKQSRLVLTVIFISLGLLLAACGQNASAPGKSADSNTSQTTNSTQQEGPRWGGIKYLRAGGGSSGSGVYQLTATLAEPWNDISGIMSTTVAGDATSNVKSVESGELEVAYTSPDIAFSAIKGEGEFAGKPVKNVQFLHSMFPLPLVVAVRADSPIQSIEELKSKRITSGVTGQIADSLGKALMEAYGITPENIKQTGGSWNSLSTSQLVEMMQSKTLDAFILTSGREGQNTSFKPLVDSVGVKFLPVAEDKIDAVIKKYPFLAKDYIKGGIYPNQPGDYDTIASGVISIVSTKLPEDLVYEMLKGTYSEANLAKIYAITSMFKPLTLDTAFSLLPASGLTGHPGAVKFFEEKGIKIPK